MAQRETQKASRSAPRQADAASGMADAVQRLEARATALERERDRLKTELEAAQSRIAVLEESRRQAANRIDWVIDSLHSLVDKDA